MHYKGCVNGLLIGYKELYLVRVIVKAHETGHGRITIPRVGKGAKKHCPYIVHCEHNQRERCMALYASHADVLLRLTGAMVVQHQYHIIYNRGEAQQERTAM